MRDEPQNGCEGDYRTGGNFCTAIQDWNPSIERTVPSSVSSSLLRSFYSTLRWFPGLSEELYITAFHINQFETSRFQIPTFGREAEGGIGGFRILDESGFWIPFYWLTDSNIKNFLDSAGIPDSVLCYNF